MLKQCSLVLPNASHEEQYTRMMDRWEAMEDNIQPQLLRRFSSNLGKNIPYARWLAWCEDDRTTGQMLSTKVPASLYFLITSEGEILGAVVINHQWTHRGHIHIGIAPWNRGKGYGTIMLRLALNVCKDKGMTSVQICPFKNRPAAIKAILKCGGRLLEEFYEDGEWSQRYEIDLA